MNVLYYTHKNYLFMCMSLTYGTDISSEICLYHVKWNFPVKITLCVQYAVLDLANILKRVHFSWLLNTLRFAVNLRFVFVQYAHNSVSNLVKIHLSNGNIQNKYMRQMDVHWIFEIKITVNIAWRTHVVLNCPGD